VLHPHSSLLLPASIYRTLNGYTSPLKDQFGKKS
jgi:hypothetical protein